MGVLVRSSDFSGEVTGRLTTRFVKDWRLKTYDAQDGTSYKRWMRRSRLVSREYAHERFFDVFSPATGVHLSNLLPMKYLRLKQLASEAGGQEEYSATDAWMWQMLSYKWNSLNRSLLSSLGRSSSFVGAYLVSAWEQSSGAIIFGHS